MANYYVYIATEKERGCPKFDDLDEAIKKYNSTPMNSLGDNVFLGYEDGTGKLCFDIIHKFFGDNILINDYLNHDSEDIREIVRKITDKMFVRYQWTYDILKGVLIDYASPFAGYKARYADEKWNEAYLSTFTDNELQVIGWVKPTRETYDSYGWNYPKVASYISMMNVPVYDNRGHRHDVDIDPRVYLQLREKKVSMKAI